MGNHHSYSHARLGVAQGVARTPGGFFRPSRMDSSHRDLEALEEVEVKHQGKHFLLRSETKGICGKVFPAVGMALPPRVHQIRGGRSA